MVSSRSGSLTAALAPCRQRRRVAMRALRHWTLPRASYFFRALRRLVLALKSSTLMKPRPSRRRPSRRDANQPGRERAPGDNLCSEDDANLKLLFGSGHPKSKTDRKARQLCSQVADTLSYVLSGECGDEVLRSLLVMAVDPAPDSTQLAVTVCQDSSADPVTAQEVLLRLSAASGKLRAAVASAITRKRAPKLLFRLLPPLRQGMQL